MAHIAEASADPAPAVDPELPFYMGFTSGSTGKPKAFTRSHRSWVESFHCTKTYFLVSSNDKVLIPGTLLSSHFLYGAVSTLYLGEPFVCLKIHSRSNEGVANTEIHQRTLYRTDNDRCPRQHSRFP